MTANVGIHDSRAALAYDFSPTVMIFADSDQGIMETRQSADSLGARIGCVGPLENARRHIKGRGAVDAILMDVQGTPNHVLEDVLDDLEMLAHQHQLPSTISAPIRLIDRVCARASHPSISILCGPTALDRASALGISLAEKHVRVADANTELESMRLRRLADEVGRIAKALSNLSSTTPANLGLSGNVSDMVSSFTPEPMAEAPTARHDISSAEIRAIIRARRLRDRFFDHQLFADPAWDMLLDLMAARLDQVQVAVSSLCIAAAVPPTTALRWIKTMTDARLFERVADPDDGRRIFITLSESAVGAMQRYFSAADEMRARVM